jgi:hypothetical protein
MRLGGNNPPGFKSPILRRHLSSSYARTLSFGGLLLPAFQGICAHTAAVRPRLYLTRYPRGQAGFWQVGDVRVKRILSRGRAFSMGKIGAQRETIIFRRDPAGRPVLEGAGEVTAPAPAASREQSGSGLRERLARARELNEGRPLPSCRGAPGASGHDRAAFTRGRVRRIMRMREILGTSRILRKRRSMT